MSSIYGFVSERSLPDAPGILSSMARALPEAWEVRGPGWTSDDGLAAVGHGVHRRTPIFGQAAVDRESGVRCWVEGTFDGPVLSREQPAEGLLHGFLDSGSDCLRDIQDSFNVAWWSPADRTLTLANDRLGYRPLYIARRDRLLVFATHMAQLAASGLVDLEPNPHALAELLGVNSLIGDHTVFAGTEVLAPASVLEFDGASVRTNRYWRLDEVEMVGGYDHRRIDKLEHAFADACAQTAGRGSVGMALSGGLDARCTVAATATVADGLAAFTEGPVDSLDYVLAHRVAAALDLPHQQVELRDERVVGWLEPGVSLLGGNVATLEVHPCHHFLEPSLPFDRILLGLVGEYTRAAYPRPTDYRTADFETLLRRIRKKVFIRTGTLQDPVQLWVPEYSHLSAWAGERLEESLRSYRWQHSPLDVADYYYLEVRGRRALAKGPTMGRLGAETASPYLQPAFVEQVLSIPTPDRLGNRIQMDLIDRFAPQLNRIPYASPPAHTTKWQELIGERSRRWGQRMRPSRKKMAPAFDILGWSRGALRPVLDDLLNSPEATFRRYLEWAPVRERLDAHFEGHAKNTHLVAALTSFELAHRMWASCSRTRETITRADGRPVQIVEA